MRSVKVTATSFVSLVGVALVVAGCGSSSSNSSSASNATASAASSTAASSGSTAAPSSLRISTAKGTDGVYLTGASGRALYLWAADTGSNSSCSGACAKVWPPVISSSTPSVAGGVTAADVGTITRADGSEQVTYMGHPLYYYVADPTSGTTKGQGSNSFGAKWWLLAASGKPITARASSSSSGSSSSSSGGSSTSSSGWA